MSRLPPRATTEDAQPPDYGPYATNRHGLSGKVWRLQQKLYAKAKREPKFRFYALYDRIYREDVMLDAWCRVAANDGAPGVDGVSIRELRQDEEALNGLLSGLRADLQRKTYRPSPVKRVYIPKANGKQRPLGIPTVRDRIAQMAALIILEPIFEADFQPGSYG
ncbi:MAG: group II intron reverse transcriptase/maturase, partial [Candidatus Hydrogenedentes bacterium]|nr:group II intron reverse transcriptase/maturase [Candidatus Hydrogenedentota bacterium]